MTDMDRLKEKLDALHLKTMARHAETVFEEARAKNAGTLSVLDRLADLEMEHRRQSAVHLRISQSRLGQHPTIDQFNFGHHKSRQEQRQRILALLDSTFIEERRDVVLIGNPGTGKTFLAQCFAYAACNNNRKVLFTSAVDMINQLAQAQVDQCLLKKLRTYITPDLLVIDEIGYLSLGTQGSNLFFQVISARHQKRSTIVTTNLVFTDWGQIFESSIVAVAIADRIVQNMELLILKGKSYRDPENLAAN